MISESSEKYDEQNELIENDSDNIININKLKSKAVRFEESVVKDKKKKQR